MSRFSDSLSSPYALIAALLLITAMVLSVMTRKLTLMGSVVAVIIGGLVFLAAGMKGILMLMVFFLLGVAATAYKKEFKVKLDNQSIQTEGRTAGQVLANGGVAGLMAVMALLYSSHSAVFLLMMAASLAAALSDTLSSELGTIYGSRFYNILGFKKDENGLDGVISLEGTLIGVTGAFIVGLIYAGISKTCVLITIAGILGNLMDSLLGAVLERKGYIGNNLVNFLNTLFAAVVCMIFYIVA
ncbi:DUF92 domain-containing protein [Pedobacter frigoris]|uniref:DUF92 domain-containing protein n=1 Tax=Pedobacter frigoris TaxID=2571272 RepID=UPI0029307E5A|nr:DUF92 domain-containing protein [Pedobacter frigoris]